MARSYSDPSYGSRKIFKFNAVSMGTRSDGVVVLEAGAFTATHPVTVTNFTMTVNKTGDGGTSQWVLLKGTTALGTLNFVTNPTKGTIMSTAPAAAAATGTSSDIWYLQSVTSVADPAPYVTGEVEYVERFLESDTD